MRMHTPQVAAKHMDQKFTAHAPNRIRVTDLTYILTDEGWLYLAGHKDILTGDIVGYAMGERMIKNLVSQSLFRVVAAKRPEPGLIHHSDRGSQYSDRSKNGNFHAIPIMHLLPRNERLGPHL